MTVLQSLFYKKLTLCYFWVKFRLTVSRQCSFKSSHRAGSASSATESLPAMCEALGSVPSITANKNKKFPYICYPVYSHCVNIFCDHCKLSELGNTISILLISDLIKMSPVFHYLLSLPFLVHCVKRPIFLLCFMKGDVNFDDVVNGVY